MFVDGGHVLLLNVQVIRPARFGGLDASRLLPTLANIYYFVCIVSREDRGALRVGLFDEDDVVIGNDFARCWLVWTIPGFSTLRPWVERSIPDGEGE